MPGSVEVQKFWKTMVDFRITFTLVIVGLFLFLFFFNLKNIEV